VRFDQTDGSIPSADGQFPELIVEGWFSTTFLSSIPHFVPPQTHATEVSRLLAPVGSAMDEREE
jgi:hypothetical protein